MHSLHCSEVISAATQVRGEINFPATARTSRTFFFTEFSSPIGMLQLRGTAAALTAVYMEDHRHQPAPPSGALRDAGPFRETRRQLEEYFAGERRAFDLPLAPAGTDFQRGVWAALCEIPYGATLSYGGLARRIGRARAVRAVGLANGRNPLSIVVPCHRVIGADGSLTGYGGGLERKQFLLALEQTHCQRPT